MSLLGRLFGRQAKAPSAPKIPFTAEIAPEERFFVIGDIHGCQEILESLIEQIDAIDANAKIICVGDYIDRGERSADVLRYLHEMSKERGDRLVCLRGNHEDMFLSFLEDPDKHGSRWLRYGGLQTVASFGDVGLDTGNLPGMRDDGIKSMGPELLSWVQNLSLSFRSGNVAVTHAGADPAIELEYQSSHVLMWGHPDVQKINRSDGVWVVFGHVIQDQPSAEQGVIATDTGAYATGRLTAAEIQPGKVDFHIV